MAASNLKILKTGIENLDTILGGGIPVGSLVMLVGNPGTGKTILIQQLCFAWAARNQREAQTVSSNNNGSDRSEKATSKRPARTNRAVYFSTLSEPHDKLIEHIQQFDFFNPDLLVEHLRLLSLSTIMDQGLDKVADLIVTTARTENAGLIAIDGFRVMESLANNRLEVQKFLYRLSAQLSVLGTTLVISLERSLIGADSEGDLTIADGLIGFYSIIEGAREYHRLEIRKLRGMPRLSGRHTYNITGEGLKFYPRLETQISHDLANIGSGQHDVRLSMGVPDLDKLMGGGIPRNSSTLLVGSPGVGKSLLGLHFLMEGVKKGEKGLFVGFHEGREQIMYKAANFGLDLRSAVESGQIILLNQASVELELDEIAELIKTSIEENSIKRLVLDDLNEIQRTARYEDRAQDFSAALVNYLKSKEVTMLSNYVISKLIGMELDLAGTPLSSLAENLLLLRQIESNNRFYRRLSILQMRDSKHDSYIHDFKIEAGVGIELLQSQNEGGLILSEAPPQ